MMQVIPYGIELATRVVDKLSVAGEFHLSDKAVLKIFQSPGQEAWIQLNSFPVHANFTSRDSFIRWLALQDDTTFQKLENETPDEKAFMANMLYQSKTSVFGPPLSASILRFFLDQEVSARPHSQAKFQKSFLTVGMNGSWDVVEYTLLEQTIKYTWFDFFDLDHPSYETIESYYTFDKFYVQRSEGSRTSPLLSYLLAENLISAEAEVLARQIAVTTVELKPAFVDLLRIFNGSELRIKVIWKEVKNRYSEKHRQYHTLAHLRSLFAVLSFIKAQLEDWEMVQVAIFYHDLVYDVTRTDNEAKSAEEAARLLNELGLDRTRIDRCLAHIMATQHHSISSDPDSNLFSDADLVVLGSSREVYDQYASQIRSEYQHFPDQQYKEGRAAVLKSFLERPFIYHTPYFRDRYEIQARKNIKSELDSLTS